MIKLNKARDTLAALVQKSLSQKVAVIEIVKLAGAIVLEYGVRFLDAHIKEFIYDSMLFQ